MMVGKGLSAVFITFTHDGFEGRISKLQTYLYLFAIFFYVVDVLQIGKMMPISNVGAEGFHHPRVVIHAVREIYRTE